MFLSFDRCLAPWEQPEVEARPAHHVAHVVQRLVQVIEGFDLPEIKYFQFGLNKAILHGRQTFDDVFVEETCKHPLASCPHRQLLPWQSLRWYPGCLQRDKNYYLFPIAGFWMVCNVDLV